MSDANTHNPVGREEFESHQRSVNRHIEKMSSAISELSTSLRNDIKDLSAFHTDAIAKNKNQGFVVFSVILTAFAGLYAFMDGKVDTERVANDRLANETNSLLISKLERYDAVQDDARRESSAQSKSALEKEIHDLATLMVEKIDHAGARSAARDEIQGVDIDEIKRRLGILESRGR